MSESEFENCAECVVVGSGPAAIAAAKALIDRGRQVTLFDVALSLEPELEGIRNSLAITEPTQWDRAAQRKITDATQADTKGIPKKLLYGSDFVYRSIAPSSEIHSRGAKVLRSFASGGLSNVWGACVLPYPSAELEDWPIAAVPQDQHYEAIFDFVPLSAVSDDLEASFPLHCSTPTPLPMSEQARSFRQALARNALALEGVGIRFGQSRLAVRNDSSNNNWCRECAMCLYGCPYNLIYSARETLRTLISSPAFDYRAGMFVKRLTEGKDGVEITTLNVTHGTEHRFSTQQVFVGAGLIESARLILESLGKTDCPLEFRHSDRFTMPFMRFSRTMGVSDQELHTLCQMFIEIQNEKLCRRSVHLQVYGYNDLYQKAIAKKLGGFSGALQAPVRVLLERLLVMFGYLHSDVSSTFSLQLTGRGAVEILGSPNPEAKKTMFRTMALLLRHARQFGGLACPPTLDQPGGGNHSGGSFPMTTSPSQWNDTDILGRPRDLRRVHLVDSSTFPSLPATTVTLAAMANANRIVSQSEV